MRKYNSVSLVISGLAIVTCFYIYNQVKTVEKEMLLSVSNNEKLVLQIKGILEREKLKGNGFIIRESVEELDSSSAIANVKKTENESKIENDLIKQQQEIKNINQQLATMSKQLSERTSMESLPVPRVAAPLVMAEQQQKNQERRKEKDAYYENYWQTGVENAELSSELSDKLQEKFSNNNSGVVINSTQCTNNSCKISLDYTGGRSPLLDLRTQLLGKNIYFTEKIGSDGQRRLTIYTN